MFADPLGSKTLGAINRAIAGAPIDIVMLLVVQAKQCSRRCQRQRIMSALGSSDAMAKRMGRDVYGLGVAAGTLAPTAGPKMTPGQDKSYVFRISKKAKACCQRTGR